MGALVPDVSSLLSVPRSKRLGYMHPRLGPGGECTSPSACRQESNLTPISQFPPGVRSSGGPWGEGVGLP